MIYSPCLLGQYKAQRKPDKFFYPFFLSTDLQHRSHRKKPDGGGGVGEKKPIEIKYDHPNTHRVHLRISRLRQKAQPLPPPPTLKMRHSFFILHASSVQFLFFPLSPRHIGPVGRRRRRRRRLIFLLFCALFLLWEIARGSVVSPDAKVLGWQRGVFPLPHPFLPNNLAKASPPWGWGGVAKKNCATYVSPVSLNQKG